MFCSNKCALRSRVCGRSMSWWSPSGGGGSLAAGLGLGAGLLALGGAAYCWWKYRRDRGGYSASPGPASRQRPRRDTSDEQRLKLFHSFPFRSCRCAWLVNELGVSEYVDVEPVSLHSNDASGLLQYREVHPHGTLPALRLGDGTVMLESSGICLYLAEVFLDPDGLNLMPDPEYMANYYNFITYATSTVDHILEPLYTQLTNMAQEQRNHSLVDSARRKFDLCANVLSACLGDRDFICGSKFTAADCVVGYSVWWASLVQEGALLRDFPVLQAYLERLQARPAFQQTFKRPVDP